MKFVFRIPRCFVFLPFVGREAPLYYRHGSFCDYRVSAKNSVDLGIKG